MNGHKNRSATYKDFSRHHPFVLSHLKMAYILGPKHNKLLFASSINATCFGPYKPSSKTQIHDLKYK